MSTTTTIGRSLVLLAAILSIVAAPVVADQPVDQESPTPTEMESQQEGAPEVDAGDEAVSSDSRCPRRGRQRGWQGKESDVTDDTPERGGCRCGHGSCRRGMDRSKGRGAGYGRGPGRQGADRGAGGGGRHGKQQEMAVYRELLENHESIERAFEEIPGGIRSTTTSPDPNLVPVIQRHVVQMADLMENGGWIRRWDPLFAEIFEHADKIDMSIEKIENGVIVTETSEDEEVASLIRAHAQKVMEFVGRGQEAYDEPTPLPEGYESPAEE